MMVHRVSILVGENGSELIYSSKGCKQTNSNVIMENGKRVKNEFIDKIQIIASEYDRYVAWVWFFDQDKKDDYTITLKSMAKSHFEKCGKVANELFWKVSQNTKSIQK
ncbi:hypothetical protein F4V43_01950 [Paenibacillus spiritus]|uniref:Uncharacterized protein n=1 Tax=Paenibacillus spiritus TaxID=2496557 RepID=A0A5J5GHT6_9BACL|nr:hypothetical protein [Paenibacillus spiritus]KAA9007272.1 hypothetical protein F4V43_01950 [Paenibacillus spiritus]